MSDAASNNKGAPLMREEEVLFLDFLGFAQLCRNGAIKGWDP
jgi:hypothetical protein